MPPLAPTHPVAPAPPPEVSPSSPALSGGRLAPPALAARRRRLALRGLGDGQAAPLGLRGGVSPMALYRLVCAFGHHSLVTVLTRCGLPLPVYFLADEKHTTCLADKVYLPTIVRGRVIWHLGYTEDASAAAFTASYGVFHRAASQQEPSYQVKGVLTDGFDSTTKWSVS